MNALVRDLPDLGLGVITTFGVSLAAMLFAVLLGFAAGIWRSQAALLFDLPVLAAIEFLRGIPLLVLMYFIYFGLPQLGIRTNENLAAIAALALYAGALASEIVRGAIVSIAHGQTEAAQALGLGKIEVLGLVVVPQALRRMLPPFVALFATIVESSSLAALINVHDLLQAVRTHAESDTALKLPLYTLALVGYFAINYPVSAASRRLARRFA